MHARSDVWLAMVELFERALGVVAELLAAVELRLVLLRVRHTGREAN